MIHLRSAPIVVAAVILVTGCAGYSAGTYERMLDEYQAAEDPQDIVSRFVPADAPDELGTDEGATTTGTEELREYLRRWEETAKQAGPSTAGLVDFGDSEMRPRRDLAADTDALADALFAPVDERLLLAAAFERHPGVKAARESVRAAAQRYPQALYLDSVLSQYNAFTKQLDTGVGPTAHKSMIGMSFPLPGAVSLKGRIVADEVSIAQQDVDVAVRDLITDVRLAFADYVYVEQAASITAESQELLRQMVTISRTKFRVGIGKYHSVVMAQLELAKMADILLTLDEQRATIVATINRLLDVPVDQPLGPPRPPSDEEFTVGLAELLASGVDDRQELNKQRLAIERMETMIEMARDMVTPEPTLGASYFQDRMKIGSGTGVGRPTFMAQPPLNRETASWFAQRDAYVREMEVRVDAMRQKLEAAENGTRLMVHTHYTKTRTEKRSVALHRNTLLPQARQAVQAAATAYRATEVDFLTFLDSQRTLLNLQLSEQRARRNHRKHVAQLEQAVGTRLPRRPLDLTEASVDTAESPQHEHTSE